MRIYLTIIVVFIILSSCSKQEEKIEFLKNTLQIELLSDVNVLENEVEHNELFLPDYTFNMTLSLNNNQIEKIKKQIISVPYFNELEYYRWTNGRRYMMDNGGYNFKTVQDSIASTKYRGSWIKTSNGYEFVDFGKTNDSVKAWLNTETNTLKFVFVDM